MSSVQPSTGQAGTVVSISGSQLRGQGANFVNVTLGGVVASIVNECDTGFVVVAGAYLAHRTLGTLWSLVALALWELW